MEALITKEFEDSWIYTLMIHTDDFLNEIYVPFYLTVDRNESVYSVKFEFCFLVLSND